MIWNGCKKNHLPAVYSEKDLLEGPDRLLLVTIFLHRGHCAHTFCSTEKKIPQHPLRNLKWPSLGSNQGLADYESATLTS